MLHVLVFITDSDDNEGQTEIVTNAVETDFGLGINRILDLCVDLFTL